MNTPATYRLPESLPADLREFRRMTEQFRAGALPAARYQAFRVPQGVYEQRKSGSYMLRARLVAGVATPEQLRAVAEVGERYGSGLLHLTSRQDLQVHDAPAESLADALERLAQAGLSTKGGGGNTVRTAERGDCRRSSWRRRRRCASPRLSTASSTGMAIA
jgi:sulfite reductase (ferredoxin)